MKQSRILFFALAFLTTSFVFSQENKPTLKVNFSSKGKKGILYIAVYDSEDNFMKVKLQKQKIDMSSGENTQLKIGDLVVGKEYAITSFLDENGNETLDKNAFGVPMEPYGFSNNVKGYFGPPSFEEVKVVFLLKNNPISIIID
ncbi:DUF2141 domain-containing protein [Flavobacterium sp. GT3R68]|uniref:DUF2141 domain-containing protein n=1 Tax=Flavobacterium sp. GT3R68 TaxID=2594437 RepID=UPI00163D8112|nr:DUF2141 domain-containing protein [Flavobacterium sp. GT3R68]